MERERLGSRLGFILLSAGCAIGIGNVWKFFATLSSGEFNLEQKIRLLNNCPTTLHKLSLFSATIFKCFSMNHQNI